MLDKNDAPDGYVAKKATMLCGGCKFIKKRCLEMPELNCTPGLRKDKQLVIFVKNE